MDETASTRKLRNVRNQRKRAAIVRSFILELLATAGVGSVIIGCGGSSEIHSLGNLPAAGGASVTSSSISTSSGGAVGSDSTTSNSSSGSAGTAELPDCSQAPEDGCQFAEGHDIRAIAADETRLYWVEYGTEDELGNPRYDGKIMAQDFDGGPPEQVGGDLAAPVGLALSESYFYVDAERWQDENGGEQRALIRLPRAGGSAELVQAGLSPKDPDGTKCHYPCFAATPDFGYFYHRGGVHRVSEEPGAAASELWGEVTENGFVASTSDDTVYFNLPSLRFQRLLFGAEAPEQLLPTLVSSMEWDADTLYWLEYADDTLYLVRWQPGNGSPRRVAAVENAPVSSVGPLKVAEGNYFGFIWHRDGSSKIVSGTLAEPEQVTTRVEFPDRFDSGQNISERWLGTRDAVYWIEEGAILRSP